MARDLMNYKKMIERSLMGVVRESLTRIADKGFPGNHHLYISFRTHFPNVTMPEHLRSSHPNELTIVLQHQFWGLEVAEDRFQITLSFKGNHEFLSIPFAAITSFVDPSVEFGLQFEVAGEIPGDDDAGPQTIIHQKQTATLPDKANNDEKSIGVEGEKVIALDKFRKD